MHPLPSTKQRNGKRAAQSTDAARWLSHQSAQLPGRPSSCARSLRGLRKNLPEADPKLQRVEITIAWTAIIKVLLGCLLALVAVRLWPLAELLLLALLIAIALKPLIQWTRRRHWPRWAGVLLSAFLLLGSATLAIGLLAPTIGHQGRRR